MAYLDWGEVARGKEQKESYEALKAEVNAFYEKERLAAKKKLESKKGFQPMPKQKRHKYSGAIEHFLIMEAQLKEKERELEKYRKFFEMLKELTPRHFSVHDVIG